MTDQIMMVNLYVRSQAEARSFWLDVMGWKVLREGPLDECRTWLEVAPEGAQTSLSLLEISMINEAMPGRSTPAPDLILRCPDAHAEHARLSARGARVEELRDDFFGVWFMVYDPDGNGFMVMTPVGAA